MMTKLRIGILGAGHLGRFHIQQAKELQDVELVGFYDPDQEKVKKAEEDFNVKGFDSMDDLIDSVDIVDVVTPTLSHYECASKALRKFKHVFIEKPITNTIEEARSLLNLVHEAKVKVQVGHVERFNPAFVAAEKYIVKPKFIETHRLAEFNPRGTDVSVVLDLMIHDIDIILSVVKSPVKKISASGVAVVSDTPDIANARLEFVDGCVANITASRISMKNMRKSRFFQRDAYIAVDFLEKSAEIVRMSDVIGEADPFDITVDLGPGKGSKKISFDKPEIEPVNAIREELRTFVDAIKNDTDEIVSIEDGLNALEIAYKILELIK
jgi:predicted dehydrogenase